MEALRPESVRGVGEEAVEGLEGRFSGCRFLGRVFSRVGVAHVDDGDSF